MYICKVCGFDKLEEPQYLEGGSPNFVICDCCGFQSGYDDLDQGKTFEEYRNEWILNGAPWFNNKKKPSGWRLELQLKNLTRHNDLGICGI